MCLYSKSKTPKIANKDIICYKMVIKRNDNLFSWIEYFLLKIGENVPKETITTIGEAYYDGIRPTSDIRYVISKGYLHSYKSLFYYDISLTQMLKIPRYKIYECIIPEGTEYYEDDQTFASKKLIILKEYNGQCVIVGEVQ